MELLHSHIILFKLEDINGYIHYINPDHIVNISEQPLNNYYIIYMFNGNQIKVSESEVKQLE